MMVVEVCRFRKVEMWLGFVAAEGWRAVTCEIPSSPCGWTKTYLALWEDVEIILKTYKTITIMPNFAGVQTDECFTISYMFV